MKKGAVVQCARAVHVQMSRSQKTGFWRTFRGRAAPFGEEGGAEQPDPDTAAAVQHPSRPAANTISEVRRAG